MARPLSKKELERAEEILRVLKECGGSRTATARRMGIESSHLRRTLRRLAARGYEIPPSPAAPMVLEKQSLLARPDGSEIQHWDKLRRDRLELDEAELPDDPRLITRASVHTDGEGKVISQWRTWSKGDAARAETWRALADDLLSGIGAAEPIPRPKVGTDDLAAEIPVGDHHFGMLSWKQETGDDYDLQIAERLLVSASHHLIERAPPCRLCVLEFLGDLTHYDSFVPETPRNKNKLDSDTRFGKIALVAQRVIIAMIDAALRRFSEVRVEIVPGNHDPLTSKVWLKLLVSAWYRNEPRVIVDMSQRDFLYWEYGRNLIGLYHGHSVKMKDLPYIMAQDMPQAWGRTEYRYWRTGHVHHDRLWVPAGGDFGKSWVESVRILPPTDAWGHNEGFRPLRDMKLIVLHREFGEWERKTVNPRSLQLKEDG